MHSENNGAARGRVVITGASQGLGEALAFAFARRGFDLVLVARDEARLRAVAERLRAEHGRAAEVVAADLGTAEGLARVLAALRWEDVEVLVNNAGFGESRAFHAVPYAEAEAMLRLNVEALTRLTHAAAQAFGARGRGRILNVASTAAFQPNPGFALYGATKAFVLSFSEAIREELRPRGVTVGVLCPGPTRTAFHERAGTGEAWLVRRAMMPVERVAEAGCAGCLAGRGVIVPGWLNRCLIFSLRVTPRFVVPAVSAWLMRK